ncbi:30S ribosomal protein S8 [Oscillatoria sp. FACHB-1406]|uniref:30S ribosomal protein S8 n=1 Tax=Oscillatoria sp. FACHB-1406 TaxID=2692846 RepID=UPI001683D1C8|nr:30S ribosomal protein S8 [Oscillatoria sp. FACHB-1406]MBD2578087.1 hypothetical protein [Oscillatoria sp. FACHB-1406]
MTRKLTIELPDELEQHLLAEAQRLNTSLENVVVLSLVRSRSLEPGLTPSALSESDSEEPIAESLRLQKEHEITEIVERIRAAKTAGNLTAEIPATPLAFHLIEVMKNSGLIADFQRYEDIETNPCLQIHLNPSDRAPVSQPPAPEDFPEAIARILQNLQSEDPTVRILALTALGEHYSEP